MTNMYYGSWKSYLLCFRFRVIVRSLSTFLLAQMPSKTYIRNEAGAAGAVKSGSRGTPVTTPTSPSSPTSPSLPTGPSLQATQALTQLEALRNNKTYSLLREHIIYAGEYVADPLHNINDAPGLLVYLTRNLYQGQHYLSLLFAGAHTPQSPT